MKACFQSHNCHKPLFILNFDKSCQKKLLEQDSKFANLISEILKNKHIYIIIFLKVVILCFIITKLHEWQYVSKVSLNHIDLSCKLVLVTYIFVDEWWRSGASTWTHTQYTNIIPACQGRRGKHKVTYCIWSYLRKPKDILRCRKKIIPSKI